LTGLYSHTHGILDNTDRGPRSHELITWPRLLHDAGYETVFVGKWHMGVDDRPRQGFDHYRDRPFRTEPSEAHAVSVCVDIATYGFLKTGVSPTAKDAQQSFPAAS
jgi:arylsulfatase A-like enzyme